MPPPVAKSDLLAQTFMEAGSLASQVGRVFKNVSRQLKEQAQEFISNDSPLEKSLKEATSNTTWGCTTTVLDDIARSCHDYHDYSTVMKHVWEELAAKPKQWKRIYKTLTLFEYLIRHGPEHLINEARDYLYRIRCLTGFSYTEDGKERGAGIREKSKFLVEVLSDSELLASEREKARQSRGRYVGIGAHGEVIGPMSEPMVTTTGPTDPWEVRERERMQREREKARRERERQQAKSEKHHKQSSNSDQSDSSSSSEKKERRRRKHNKNRSRHHKQSKEFDFFSTDVGWNNAQPTPLVTPGPPLDEDIFNTVPPIQWGATASPLPVYSQPPLSTVVPTTLTSPSPILAATPPLVPPSPVANVPLQESLLRQNLEGLRLTASRPPGRRNPFELN